MLTFKLGDLTVGAGPGLYSEQWPPRKQKFSGPGGVGGWTTIQDFGMPVDDLELTLGAGAQGQLRGHEVAAIRAMQRAQGATVQSYPYEDAFHNACTVVILDFNPEHVIADLWNYTLRLSVRSATALLGVAEEE